MHKVGGVIVVCAVVFIVYLIMLVTMPTIVEVTLIANSTINASGINTTLQPGSTEILIAAPWILWFVPGVSYAREYGYIDNVAVDSMVCTGCHRYDCCGANTKETLAPSEIIGYHTDDNDKQHKRQGKCQAIK